MASQTNKDDAEALSSLVEEVLLQRGGFMAAMVSAVGILLSVRYKNASTPATAQQSPAASGRVQTVTLRIQSVDSASHKNIKR